MSDKLREKIVVILVKWYMGGGDDKTAGEIADRILSLVSADREKLAEALKAFKHDVEHCGLALEDHWPGRAWCVKGRTVELVDAALAEVKEEK